MPGTVVGRTTISDERVGRHFQHHERFQTRQPEGVWRFAVVQVPIRELYCLYDDPGVRPDTNPAGLMGSVGAPSTGYRGVAIADMAARIAAALAAGRADPANRALQRVLELRDGGLAMIRSQDEPLAVSYLNGAWFVREGVHRTVALALSGAQIVEAIDFESGQLEGAV